MKKDRPSRRRVLIGTAALAAGSLGLRGRAGAAEEDKVEQFEARYQHAPSGGERCAECRNFIAPDSCRKVAGTIIPNGWCMFWTKK